jgi:predicted extracellular nuclease
MIRWYLFIFIFSTSFIYANTTFKVATYNVQNLFDLHYDGNEYKDYIPYQKSQWNKKNFNKKIKNIQKVVKDLDADILALEEVESIRVIKELNKKIKYKYFSISNKKTAPTISAIFSKYPIQDTKSIYVKSTTYHPFKDILRVKIIIKKYPLYIYVNHWPSKRHPEIQRIAYAKAISKDIKNINYPFIIMGDLNSHYQEYKNNRKKNKYTAINSVLKSSILVKNKYKMVTKKLIKKDNDYLYNLWLDINKKKRYSYQYRRKKITLDHILLPHSMFDNKGIEYKNKSFGVFKPSYLFVQKRGIKSIYSWQKENYKYGSKTKYPRFIHIGKGYSDHLPIFATFYLIGK